jgi:hypothetical protein
MSSSDDDPTPLLPNLPNDRPITDEDVPPRTTSTPDNSNPSDASDTIPSQTPEESNWTCPLPIELLGLVLEFLVQDEALGTLARAQSTSRAMYSLTTPHLYRNIIIHQHQAFALFGLLDTYPREDNGLFIGPLPSQHPIDLHLNHRLRYLFSHTQTLVFRVEDRPEFNSPTHVIEPLNRFKEVVDSLWGLNQPTLWPAMRRCQVDLNALSNNPIDLSPPGSGTYCFRDLPTLAEPVFAHIHASHFTVLLPNPYADEEDTYSEAWVGCFDTVRADHVELVNYDPEDSICGPRAKSVTVYFRDLPLGDDGQPISAPVDMKYFLNHGVALRDLAQLTLVGIPRLGDVTNAGAPKSVNDVYEDIGHSLRWVMEARLEHGNQEDLKITVQPDTSSNGVASAISRIYKQSDYEK